MIDKDFVAYKEFGKSREYPLVKKNTYFSKHVGLIKNFLMIPSQFASFFTNETNLSEKELEELKKNSRH
jgi:hypothetical protein